MTVKTLIVRAASGDLKAINTLVDLVLQVFGPDDRGGGAGRFSAHYEVLLAELLAEHADPDGTRDATPDEEDVANDPQA